MERSTSALTYKGSISDAITEARRQKKLFVVYISGDDEDSVHLEQSTWVDLDVAGSLSKCCVFLHLIQGSVEASQFSAIYPQQSIPSISAIGYNGVIIWKHEGYISAANFLENIEKAWAALHLQVLAAAYASNRAASLSSTPLSVTSSEQASPSSFSAASTSADRTSQSLEAKTVTHPEELMNQVTHERITNKDVNPCEETSSHTDHVHDVEINGGEESSIRTEKGKEVLHAVSGDLNCSSACKVGGSLLEENIALDESDIRIAPESSEMLITDQESSRETSCTATDEVDVKTRAMKVDDMAVHANVAKSNDILLNIRLPSGTSLQTKFTVRDTLRLVKNFVDESQIDGTGSYDLAVPYPRRVFSEEDMDKVLSELGFASRQALIVVPHHQVTQPSRVPSSSNNPNNPIETSSSASGEGYFGYVKKMLSYINPFSYVGGTAVPSTSQPAQNDGLWQYNPNPAFQSHQNPPTSDNGSNARRTSRPFGSNIHTLRHDEDERLPDDRNTFWNGNSTQYGGNDETR